MRKLKIFCQAFGIGSPQRATAIWLALIGTAVVSGAAFAAVVIFAAFPDDSGVIKSATADTTINLKSKFFDAGLGTNDQACSTCHEPSEGFTISPETINEEFDATNGLDPLFRPNDTADRPDADVSTLAARVVAYRLNLSLGVTRIGKTLPAGTDFTVEPQDTAQFGPQPNPNDPQAPPGSRTLSLFRRPLVNTNVHFDSAVLWDGRANINDMRSQVKRAARGLLLAGGPNADALGGVSDADADDVAKFMLEVFTDQIRDEAAGPLNAAGATSGVDNLLALSLDPAAPCTPLAPAATCTPSVGRMSLFDAWLSLSSPSPIDAARMKIARGQEVFNAHCASCHRTDNIANNPSPNFFVRLGMDSPETMSNLAAQNSDLQEMLERVESLPVFCLRPTSNPTPFAVSACGNDPGDVKTTDPGRALVTGQIADVGRFKPPILRGLTARSPYFHNGSADGIETLIEFYNTRFGFGLTVDERSDLAAFLEAI